MNAVPAPGWEDLVLEPFNLRVRDVLDANALGFDYADSETLLLRRSRRRARPARSSSRSRWRPPPPCRPTTSAAPNLEIGGIKHTGSSYEGLVYVNNPDAALATGADPTAGYVGSFHVFGHGGCFGASGHCEAPARAPALRQPAARARDPDEEAR